MNFSLWLVNTKGVSLKTSELYKYYVDKTKNFVKEYKNLKTCSSKRLLYFAHKYYYEYKKIKFPNIEPPKRIKEKIMRYISYLEYCNIRDNYVAKNGTKSLNGKLIAELAYIYGLRISEILNLKFQNIKDGFMTIKGKGSKVRVIPIADKFINMSLNNEGFVVNNKQKKISYSAAREILDDVIYRCNLKKCSWHSFRHGFAVRLLINKIDIYNISKLMGHSSLETTAKYLKYDNVKIKEELKKLGLFA